ncbi:hypothetical protein TCAL_10839 [Tigriopus californicus]|uniref:MORN repeat-containing protein 4 n=1 Tax=Tigriopus californicus TaxID=6832 RepID=A0A553P0K2_TIGCA|nr:MORN repeat-containing protein 4 homolog [Tigriopus californicus]TRY71224.1 hypothetical protein TCAL_10839 [Tigriopus californicus]|eukprot:TCALIF_10839-PA protein Name:"Similar to MORN4 MORN repeat-containing protein 4 (Pongo abelii)" AED:0.06 eAED:0.06 QI:14/1/1/1/1/1/3/30/190
MEEQLELGKSYEKVVTLKKKHGKCGSYTHNDGSLFIGDFDENGVKSGMGHLEVPNGSTYDGQFQKGLPNGVGIMRFPDSSRYEGEFMQGWFHGHGVFQTIGGMKFEGEFRGGRIWGNGLLTFNDGKVGSEGYFQDSRFSRDGVAKDDIKKSRKIANFARRICNETSYDVGNGWKTEEQEQNEAIEVGADI